MVYYKMFMVDIIFIIYMYYRNGLVQKYMSNIPWVGVFHIFFIYHNCFIQARSIKNTIHDIEFDNIFIANSLNSLLKNYILWILVVSIFYWNNQCAKWLHISLMFKIVKLQMIFTNYCILVILCILISSNILMTALTSDVHHKQ